MRQRKVRNLEEKVETVSAWLVEEPGPEIWDRVFPLRAQNTAVENTAGQNTAAENTVGQDTAGRDLYLEIGCGRGDFLVQQARLHPENDYIGIEGQLSVVLRALEKAAAAGLENLRFICAFVNEMGEFFTPASLAGVYLNFSDPWPKSRHAKRRLTYRDRLSDYARALRPGGSIAFKTDNEGLFEFTLEEIEALGWTPAELTRDLHGPDGQMYDARLVLTEYEKKFRQAGKPINYVKVIPDRK